MNWFQIWYFGSEVAASHCSHYWVVLLSVLPTPLPSWLHITSISLSTLKADLWWQQSYVSKRREKSRYYKSFNKCHSFRVTSLKIPKVIANRISLNGGIVLQSKTQHASCLVSLQLCTDIQKFTFFLSL